jgi:hypothetical protein
MNLTTIFDFKYIVCSEKIENIKKVLKGLNLNNRGLRRERSTELTPKSQSNGATHGRMIDEFTTLKGLNINVLEVQPFQGCDFNFAYSPPVTPMVIQILSLRDNLSTFRSGLSIRKK